MQAQTPEKEQNVDFSGVPIEALEALRLRLTQVWILLASLLNGLDY